MANFQEEMSTQIKRIRDQVETFVHDKVNPTVEKAAARMRATADIPSRLDALIALLVEKGLITEEKLSARARPAANVSAHGEIAPPRSQDQL